jgi:hypothetical protein
MAITAIKTVEPVDVHALPIILEEVRLHSRGMETDTTEMERPCRPETIGDTEMSIGATDLPPHLVVVVATEDEIGAEIGTMREGEVGQDLHADIEAHRLGEIWTTSCHFHSEHRIKFRTFRCWLSTKAWLG